MAEDPGWKPAIKGVWRMFVPAGATAIAKRASALTTMRTFTVGSVFGWFAFGGLLALLDANMEWTRGSDAIAIFGAVEVLLILMVRRRQLVATDTARLRQSFAQTFFIGYICANAPMIFGVFLFFGATRGGLTAYLIGIPFAALGIWLISPTKGRMSRLQERLNSSGSSLVLLEALDAPPEPIPPRPRPQRRRRR